MSSSEVNIPSPPPPQQDPNLRDRLREFFKKYGKIGIGVYFSVSLSTFLMLYGSIRFGVDIDALLQKVGLSTPSWTEGAGTFIITYAIYKTLLPIRLMVTIGLTPSVKRFLQRMHWIR